MRMRDDSFDIVKNALTKFLKWRPDADELINIQKYVHFLSHHVSLKLWTYYK